MTINVSAHVGDCLICGQGGLLVAREKDTGQLFVRCQECEAEWDTPELARANAEAKRFVRGDWVLVDRDDLSSHPWQRFLEE